MEHPEPPLLLVWRRHHPAARGVPGDEKRIRICQGERAGSAELPPFIADLLHWLHSTGSCSDRDSSADRHRPCRLRFGHSRSGQSIRWRVLSLSADLAVGELTSEGRNPKSEGSPKSEGRNPKALVHRFLFWRPCRVHAAASPFSVSVPYKARRRATCFQPSGGAKTQF